VSRGSAVTCLADYFNSFLPHVQGRRRRCRRYRTFDGDDCFRSIVSRLQPREVIRIRIGISHLSIVCSMLSLRSDCLVLRFLLSSYASNDEILKY
jgi:hypothetical protein